MSDPQTAAKRILNAVVGDEDAIAVARAYQEAIEAQRDILDYTTGWCSDKLTAEDKLAAIGRIAERLLASAATPTKENDAT